MCFKSGVYSVNFLDHQLAYPHTINGSYQVRDVRNGLIGYWMGLSGLNYLSSDNR